MACNDDCGQLVMEACKLVNLTVPDHIGIIGADNDQVVCGLTDPQMSSIEINFERAGYDAAHALDRLMQGHQGVPPRITAPAAHIVARRSTDFIAAEEPNLTRAFSFIRDHARSGLSVDQVAASAGLSRGALDKRFRELLGRSVAEEIARSRTEQIARVLQETSLPVGEIAEMLGFTDAKAFLRSIQTGKRSTGTRSKNGTDLPGDLEDGLPPWRPGVPF
jgi:LacI family transcriptional regulator